GLEAQSALKRARRGRSGRGALRPRGGPSTLAPPRLRSGLRAWSSSDSPEWRSRATRRGGASSCSTGCTPPRRQAPAARVQSASREPGGCGSGHGTAAREQAGGWRDARGRACGAATSTRSAARGG
ncbi:unnamed protein product, partial [Prorocentrum cordatum]